MPVLLVAVQFVLIGTLLITGPLVAEWPPYLGLEVTGLLLGGWALGSMRLGNFRVIHTPKADGRFVTRGPYRWIRHPMYSAVLVATLALVLDRPTGFRWVVWGLLCIDLGVKMWFEEKALRGKFSGYEAYCARSKRLVPWLF